MLIHERLLIEDAQPAECWAVASLPKVTMRQKFATHPPFVLQVSVSHHFDD